jgi:predicted nucleotidyltransferase
MGTPQTAIGIDQSLIEEIVRRVLPVARPDKVILFGSAAAGKMTHDSDIDLLVVEPEPIDRRGEYVRIRQALGGMGYPFDIILISTQWFEASKTVIGGIAYPAHKHGRVIYEAG